ncbi:MULTISPECIES: hypothetical protein [unclassified Streptomyces]|uniref:hypothetical protein n=1 Tax=unclassified Streptomyces TaxID=2593676 RepID=UPI0004CAD4CA|nr:hypothetical protein [Streptomyces sp. NRRL F-2747]
MAGVGTGVLLLRLNGAATGSLVIRAFGAQFAPTLPSARAAPVDRATALPAPHHKAPEIGPGLDAGTPDPFPAVPRGGHFAMPFCRNIARAGRPGTTFG